MRDSSRVAGAAGLSPLVIGLTVVAFGTSAPELAVSSRAALAGRADLALGNVVGSSIFNVLFILGLSALVTPLAVRSRLVRREVPLMIGSAVLLLLLAIDGAVRPWEGGLLAAGALVYTGWSVVEGIRAGSRRTAVDADELTIGVTVVAAGTSLPEVATSVVAAAALRFDIPVMIAVSVACLPIFFTGWSISRWEGLLLLGYYGAYVAYVLLAQQAHGALPAFSRTMWLFVIPGTALVLAVSAYRSARS